jgi:ankyrin repeat protein
MTRQEENFIECCLSNKLSIVKSLVKYNVDITVSEYWGYRIAATKGYIDLLKYLYRVDNNHESISKSGILSWAATNGQIESVEFIINQSDSYKSDTSTLQWTAASGNVEMISLLIPYCTYFDWIIVSAAKNGHTEMLSFLFDNEIEKLDRNYTLGFNNAVLSRKKMAASLFLDRQIILEKDIDKDIWEKYCAL